MAVLNWLDPMVCGLLSFSLLCKNSFVICYYKVQYLNSDGIKLNDQIFKVIVWDVIDDRGYCLLVRIALVWSIMNDKILFLFKKWYINSCDARIVCILPYLPTYLPIYLSTYLSTYLPTYLSTYYWQESKWINITLTVDLTMLSYDR